MSEDNKKITYENQIVKLMTPKTIVRNFFTKCITDGEIIKVPVRNTAVEVKEYNVANGVEMSTVQTSYKNILMDKDYAINELIDTYEVTTVPDDIIAQRIEEASRALSLTVETDAINQLTASGNHEEYKEQNKLTSDNAYTEILKMKAELAKNNIDADEMVIIVNADVEALLLTDQKFLGTGSQLRDETIQKGVIGKIAGVNVVVSNKLPQDVEVIIAGTPWLAVGENFNIPVKIDDLKDGKHIGACALMGRLRFKHAVLDKKAVLVKKIKSV